MIDPTAVNTEYLKGTVDSINNAIVREEEEKKRAEEAARASQAEAARQQALELWFNNGGSCTGAQPPEPKDIDDAIAEDEEFKRIEKQHK